ncbi:MAG: hypothetical protein CL916_09445, partial [Deltaproteobacteria bacterium]|nr:hypothetical protein [Deltaproteobacteria bacterium]
MIQQGKFNKRTFKGYVKQSCERRLFLHLGNGREGWTYQDGSTVALDEKTHSLAQTVVVYGKIFEDEYLYFLKNHGAKHILDCTPGYIDDEQWPSLIMRQKKEIEDWERITEAVQQHGFIFAFELMWKPEEAFIRHMLGVDYAQKVEVSRGDRPDVLLFEQYSGTDSFFTLDENDQILLKEREHHGLVVTVLDIKNTPIDKCERHFSDVIYYIISLLFRLKALGFSEEIAIRGSDNGILGRIEFDQLQKINPILLKDMIQGEEVFDSAGISVQGHVSVDWELYKSQCTSFQRGLSMVMEKKTNFEDVETTISKDCQYCVYSHHCLNGTLDTRVKVFQKPSGDDDIATLPSMKPQILKSLKYRDVHTVNDLVEHAERLVDFNLNQTVCDEYAPKLRGLYFQALAIQKGVVLDQNESEYQDIFAPGAFTVHLPPNKGNFFFLDVEGDPAQ